MKRKNKILTFAGSFFLWIVIAVLLSHNYAFKGIGPMSWNEIIHDWWLFILGAIAMGVESVVILDDYIQEKKEAKAKEQKEDESKIDLSEKSLSSPPQTN